MNSVKVKFTALVKRFKELQGSPSYLAKGTAIGVFVGFAPLMPLKTMLILAGTMLLPSSTVAALLVCAIICNPLTYVPLYYLAWVVGNVVLPGRASWELLEATVTNMQGSSLSEAMILAGQVGFNTGLVVLTGGVILALPLALVSYPLSFRLFGSIARKRYQKHLLDRQQEET